MRFRIRTDVRRLVDSPVVARWALFALIVVGGGLRLRVAGQDLFADELATYWVVTAHGFTGVIRTVSTTAEITPPLSFLLSWLTSQIGHSPELVRLPALVAGIGSIPLVYAIGTRTVGRPAALLATALTTLSPFMIFYSAEARGYGVLMALVLLSTLALLHALDDGGTHWWILYVTAICTAAYTHYTCIFVLAVQLAWALCTHPRQRRPLLLATTAAAVLFTPWLPSLKGDLDSPTTEILSAYSPLSVDFVRLTLGHWSVGFPFSGPKRSLSDLPGAISLLLLASSLGLGLHGLLTARSPVRAWFGRHEGQLALVLLLAVATPAGTLLQSAVGTNVVNIRALAASWPYLALGTAALITAARPALEVVAATIAVGVFALSAGTMLTTDFQRPDYSRLARFTDEFPGAVIVNGAAFTPGPLTNFEIEGAEPKGQVLRLNVPEQMETPFNVTERRPVPAEVAARAVADAGGAAIILIAGVPVQDNVQEVIDLLPPEYQQTTRRDFEGIFDLQVLVYERDGAG